MKWQDLDAQFPAGPVGDIAGAATHVTRLALGLPVRGVTRDGVLHTVRAADNWALKHNYDEDAWRGMLALIAGYYSDWDLVAQLTGGDALGTRVLAKKTFGANTRAFARQLATACARKLPADQLAVAMAEQHQRFVAGTSSPDGRTAAVAPHIYIRELAIVSDVVAATRSWLDGELVLDPAAPAANAVADGEDERVKIFERYAPELDDAAIDSAVAAVAATRLDEEWGRHHHRERLPLDDLAIQAFVARRELWREWEATIDPAVAAYLGAAPTPHTATRFGDIARVSHVALKRGSYWDEIAWALATGASIEHAKTMAWKPGRFFKDDARKLFTYLTTAVEENASEADVTPAWLDFLARRSPKTTPIVEEGELHWKSLIAIQAVITQRIGKRAASDVGVALRRAITSLG